MSRMNKRPPGSPASAGGRFPEGDSFGSFFSDPQNIGYDQGTVQTYPAQAVIFHQDTRSQGVYLIEDGLVKLVRIVPSGQHVIIGLRRRNWLIGAPSVLLDKPYSFTAMTLVPSSLRCIPDKVFLDLARTNGRFSWHVHHLLAQEIFRQMKNVEAMNCMSAQDRLERFLCDMIAEQKPNGAVPDSFSLPLTNKELAQLLAITQEHVCRVLKAMEQKGLIRRAKGMLTLTDPAGLLRKAQL